MRPGSPSFSKWKQRGRIRCTKTTQRKRLDSILEALSMFTPPALVGFSCYCCSAALRCFCFSVFCLFVCFLQGLPTASCWPSCCCRSPSPITLLMAGSPAMMTLDSLWTGVCLFFMSSKAVVLKLGSPDVLGLQLPEIMASIAGGEGFCELQPKNIWGPQFENHCVRRYTLKVQHFFFIFFSVTVL